MKLALEQTLHARVRLTRDKDALLQLPDRVKFANDQKPDLFVSIHANSMPTKKLRQATEGIETYFLSAAASGEASPRSRSSKVHSLEVSAACAAASSPMSACRAVRTCQQAVTVCHRRTKGTEMLWRFPNMRDLYRHEGRL